MWKQAISALSDAQLELIFKFCLARCMKGNPWPPELSDVIAELAAKSVKQDPFGISDHSMLNDWKRYCRDKGMYDSAELYPFKHPVQYWIFTDLHRKMIDMCLTEGEIEKQLKKMLIDWSERVANGGSISKPIIRLADRSRPRPAWIDIIEKGKKQT
ncbi:replication protein P [Arsenophonus sp. aPb]|uniref:replication protein P n=1 Tax=Arsenophonus sp. aPb TaxID=3041619 RepID=UPI0024683209|nr:replication protein P [Arsenophonus sp. aPb]WGL99712.1 replication protein P [Arsenophonus sp. aPb]